MQREDGAGWGMAPGVLKGREVPKGIWFGRWRGCERREDGGMRWALLVVGHAALPYFLRKCVTLRISCALANH